MSLDISPVVLPGRNIIKSYGNGKFQIGETHYYQSLLVSPDKIIPWSPGDMHDLTLEDFQEVLKFTPSIEILLLGCGKIVHYLSSNIRQELNKKCIVLEVMDTGAACRTFNVLLGEDRRIAVALYLVD